MSHSVGSSIASTTSLPRGDMTFMYRQAQALLTITTLFWLAACTPNSISTVPTQTATQPTCQPSPTQTSTTGFPEIHVTMNPNGEMWALLFFDKAQALMDEKFVWRITGSGVLDIQAQYEDGTIIHPIWGPEYHPSSNWHHPGDEWGTGFNFPKSGCWTLIVIRGTAIGKIYLNVLAP